MELSQQTRATWEEALRLYESFSILDLAHDGRAVFQLALEASKKLTLCYQTPLAYQLAKTLTDYAVGLYCAANRTQVA